MGVIDYGGHAALRAPGINARDSETEERPCVVCGKDLVLDGQYEFARYHEDDGPGEFLVADEQSGDVQLLEEPEGWAHLGCVCGYCGDMPRIVDEDECAGCFVERSDLHHDIKSRIGKAVTVADTKAALEFYIADLRSMVRAIEATR